MLELLDAAAAAAAAVRVDDQLNARPVNRIRVQSAQAYENQYLQSQANINTNNFYSFNTQQLKMVYGFFEKLSLL